MREVWHLFGLSLTLGAIAVFGSETLFWAFPGPTMGVVEYALLVVIYGLASATALSAVLLTGAGGWRGFWLAGAMFGFLIEGVVVGEMYLAFPFQLVWTPLAWHMLLTAGVMLALVRLSVGWSLGRQCLTLGAIGMAYGFWAAWWPLEKPELPGLGAMALYQFSGAGVAVLGFLGLDRFGRLPKPPRRALWIMPVVAASLFMLQTVLNPTPLRIFLPMMMGLTVWGMLRAKGNGAEFRLKPAPVWRYLPLFLVPAFSVLTTAVIFQTAGAIPSNAVVAFITCPVGLGLWLWQIFRKGSAV
ncbi:hypothetical protein [Neogemmobacter tilapiae]|uniref:Uncharacterized protein n=1 Tax=Neogemmobacter tilapiae TaxID=875041 RepID=A0A918TTQ7_9RHOB|nr:hypothetical protein [Gemmobacter tilapiae]GHC61494.1 hypothetical protein GCM10007315_26910 [Gemmobacter tilapiae]